jgi:hypothetical protein
MLCEFALTPQLFDDQRNSGDPNWKEHLRELGRSMFPRNAASPVVVSDLYDSSWQHVFKETVEAIKDEAAKDLARGFLSMILDATVMRPAIGNWPADEDDWAQEAIATNGVEPLKRIVVTDQTYRVVQHQGAVAVKLSQVGRPACWQDILAGRSLPLDIAVQVAALRSMLIHADFIALISPHVRGERGDETDFMVALTRSLAKCNWPRPNLIVDLHVEAPDRTAASDFESRWKNVLANVRTTFAPVRPMVNRIRVFAWPKVLSRYIFGGRVADVNGAILPAATRWAISTPHIARTGDRPDADAPFWHLLPSNEITPLHSKYYDRTPIRGPIDI